MKNKELYRSALYISVPMMIQNGITNMVTLVDNVMVGSLGTEAMTGVSIVGQLIFVLNLAVFGGLSGPSIYGAQFYGQKNKEGFQETFRLKWWISIVIVLAGFLILFYGGDALIGLYLHGGSAVTDAALTAQYGRQYMAIMMLALPPLAITQIYGTSLRETGSTVSPMTAGIISVVVDIVLNYLLIYGNFGFPRLGVTGAALATMLARYVEMIIVILWTHLHKERYSFLAGVYHTFKVKKALALPIIRKGIPLFFNELLWAGGLAALTQIYSLRGLDIVAGINISNVLINLLNVVFVYLGSGIGVLIGQTLGAGQYKKAKQDAFSLMRFAGIVSAGLMVILLIIARPFPMLYNTTGTIRGIGTTFIMITAVFFPLQGYLNALYFTVRSGGKTLITFLFDSVFSWAFTIPVAFCLCRFTGLNVFVIYALVQAADIIKLIIGYMLIKRGVWISNLAGELGDIS